MTPDLSTVKCASCGKSVLENQSPSHPDEWFCVDCMKVLEEWDDDSQYERGEV